MIIDKLKNLNKYSFLNPLFTQAQEFLERIEPGNLPPDKIEIDGNNLFAIVIDADGKGRDGTRLETHNKYIDIQYQVAGNDYIGYAEKKELVGNGYDEAKDLEFYSTIPPIWVNTIPGYFSVFFPDDAHAPMGGDGRQVKVVIKVKIK